MGLTFSQPWLLGALAAIGIPILIHLLRRRQLPRMRFSSIQFFLQTDEQSRRRRNVKRWFLLALRVLAVSLAVLALADPRVGGADPESIDEHMVIVLDSSISMRMGDRDAQARAAVRDELERMALANSVVTLIAAGPSPNILVHSKPPSKMLESLASHHPGWGTADLSAGVGSAIRLLQELPPTVTRSLRLITDGQETQQSALATVQVPEDFDFRIRVVARESHPNIAVASLKPAGQRQFEATLRNPSDTPVQTQVSWKLNGASFGASDVTLAPSETRVIRAVLPPAATDEFEKVSLSLSVDDALPYDNQLWWVGVPEKAPRVLLCQPPPSEGWVPTEFFLLTALQSAAAKLYGAPGTDSVTLHAPHELAGAISATNPDVVIMTPTGAEPKSLPVALDQFLKNGGGLILFAGNLSQRSLLMREPWAPVQLVRLETEGSSTPGGLRLHESFLSSPFSGWTDPSAQSYPSPSFSRRWQAPPRESSHVAARFHDDEPLVVTHDFGLGRCVWINTTMDSEWNNWPSMRGYLPWIDGLVRFAARKGETEVQTLARHASGSPAMIALPGEVQDQPAMVKNTTTAETFEAPIKNGHLQSPALPPGLFEISDQDGKLLAHLSSEVPSEESSAAILSAAALEQTILRGLPLIASNASPLSSEGESSKLRQLLLIVLLGLLLGEMTYGNRLFG